MPLPNRPEGYHPERWQKILNVAGLADKFGQPTDVTTASNHRSQLAIVLEDPSNGFRAVLKNPGLESVALQRQPLITVSYGDYPGVTDDRDMLLKRSPGEAQKSTRVFQMLSVRQDVDELLGEICLAQGRYLPLMERYYGGKSDRTDLNFIAATSIHPGAMDFKLGRWRDNRVRFNTEPSSAWPALIQTPGLQTVKQLIEEDASDQRGVGGTNDKMFFGIFDGIARFVGGNKPGKREPKGFSFAPSWTNRSQWEILSPDDRPDALILPYKEGGGCAFVGDVLDPNLSLEDGGGRTSRIYTLKKRLGPYFPEAEVLQYETEWTVDVDCH